ncbi:hypothetical protein TCA2_2235 [Paenibacillus sp. TCA20]|uniref:hypothetical protein n=1 Tax=Paenibacillus sp. TCA20 TaxID=1499968 RepID=UPI0004DB15DA|nr:hypothetical protein [Paenibacillus sp. TCA20]GAK39746.1 hypothetical protein TCA2_2235 [Paenibacillus sp. TCA20]
MERLRGSQKMERLTFAEQPERGSQKMERLRGSQKMAPKWASNHSLMHLLRKSPYNALPGTKLQMNMP